MNVMRIATFLWAYFRDGACRAGAFRKGPGERAENQATVLLTNRQQRSPRGQGSDVKRWVVAVSKADPSTHASRSRRRMAPDARRQALIEVALDLFNTRPYGDVSVDEIAEAAGISRPLLYHYYGGKYGVFLAALEHAADQLITVVVEASRDAPADWLLAGLRA